MDSWKTEKDVSDNRVMCPQVNQRFNFQLSNPIREDEDCLYLNVFIPLSPVIK
jgi:carboxylesterase type B